MGLNREQIKEMAAQIDALSHTEIAELLNLLGEASLQAVEDFASENFHFFDWEPL